MKRLLFALLLMVGLSVTMSAEHFKAPTRNTSSEVFTDTTTTHTYEIKNEIYNVYKTKRGAFYIWKTSKNTGKKYKYYLPKDIQIAMGRKYNDNKK